uniref:Uncharacterized protein n=1 Tax=Knipowitschia caucasica TaxID=637954 RepID=A0AAV2LDU5_KNICA
MSHILGGGVSLWEGGGLLVGSQPSGKRALTDARNQSWTADLPQEPPPAAAVTAIFPDTSLNPPSLV